MKKLWVSVLILITIIVVAGCGGGGNSTDPNVGTLQVKGITTTDAKPLKDALVEVIGTNCKGTSDANGNVTINSIPVGTYLVKCTFTGKAPVYTQMKITTATSIWEKVPILTWDENTNLGFLTGYVDRTKCNLMGTVYTADGVTRLSDVTISVSPDPVKLYYYVSGNAGIVLGNATKTDSSGGFFAVLSKGKNTIKASGGNKSFDPIEITIDEPCIFKLTIKAK